MTEARVRQDRLKRAIDVAIAVSALIVLAPGLVAIAICLWFADGGPILFRHKRIGTNGRVFDCLKFRTMRKDSAQLLEIILREDPVRRREWESCQKLTDDPRVHWIGKVLRVSSLDELPQLINVIRGEMSIVGPRPIVMEEVEKYGDDADYYLALTPGITGLWQISGRNDTTYAERVKLDVEYYYRQSTLLDLSIMFKTVPVLLYAHTGR